MRVLAIDYGTKRMGIAVSDELRTIAQPWGYLPAEPMADFLEKLAILVRDREVGLIVVGMPRNMDGSYGPAADSVNAFVARLGQEVSVPIRTWDERLTSVQAGRFLRDAGVKGKKRRETVDRTAAAILLQSYLDAASAAL